jgi:hypothetical protein
MDRRLASECGEEPPTPEQEAERLEELSRGDWSPVMEAGDGRWYADMGWRRVWLDPAWIDEYGLIPVVGEEIYEETKLRTEGRA